MGQGVQCVNPSARMKWAFSPGGPGCLGLPNRFMLGQGPGELEQRGPSGRLLRPVKAGGWTGSAADSGHLAAPRPALPALPEA